MISGIGTDLVEVGRIQQSIERNHRFLAMVFSAEEVAYCQSKARPYESYAARFAAKEAFLKALGTGWRGKLAFSDIRVLQDELGKPYLALSGETSKEVAGMGNFRIHLSISHTEHYATATVILET